MSSSMYEVFHWTDNGSPAHTPDAYQGTQHSSRRPLKPRDTSPTLSLPPTTPTGSRQPRFSKPFSQSLSSSPTKHCAIPSFTVGAPHKQPHQHSSTITTSSTSSFSSSDKTLTSNTTTTGPPPPLAPNTNNDGNNSSNNSRLSVWEFGDNFLALGPNASDSAAQCVTTRPNNTSSISGGLVAATTTTTTSTAATNTTGVASYTRKPASVASKGSGESLALTPLRLLASPLSFLRLLLHVSRRCLPFPFQPSPPAPSKRCCITHLPTPPHSLTHIINHSYLVFAMNVPCFVLFIYSSIIRMRRLHIASYYILQLVIFITLDVR